MKNNRMRKGLRPVLVVLVWAAVGILQGHGQTVQAIKVKFTLPNRITEEAVLTDKSLLIVDAGNYQYIIKPEAMSTRQASVRVAKVDYTYAASTRTFTLNRLSATPSTLVMGRSARIGGTDGGIQVTFDSVMELRDRPEPIGPCKGICCTATCFSMTCCSDINECNGGKCDCKPTKECPTPSGGGSATMGGTSPFPPVSTFVQLLNSRENKLTYVQQ
jgi:hypothetical protein